MENIGKSIESFLNIEINLEKNPPHEDDNKKRRLLDVNNSSPAITNEELSQRLNTGNFTIDTAMGEIECMISHFFKKKESFRQTFSIHSAYELLRKTSLEIIKISSKVINQEEKNAILLDKIIQQEEKASSLMQQIINIQSGNSNENNTRTYLQATQGNSSNVNTISEGRTLPLPQLPKEVKHAPSENIVIIKAEVKGETATMEMQEAFRRTIKELIGPQLRMEISAIRPSRHGGYTIILRGTTNRDAVVRKLKETDIIHESRIIAPSKKFAKMVCRDYPKNCTSDEILKEFYGRHNAHLMMVPTNQRNAKVFPTKLGWIFELTSSEAAAIDAQSGKVRFGFGQELKLEEFIPLQQCYRCSRFGHNAAECNSKDDICRLCANKGHNGRDCPKKDNKTQWKCFNCMTINQERGYELDISHAAAQLHKCNVAEHERNIKRSQLAAAGIYTSKMRSGNMQIQQKHEKSHTQNMKSGKSRKNSIGNIHRRGSTSSSLNIPKNTNTNVIISSLASSTSSILERNNKSVLPSTILTSIRTSSSSSISSSDAMASVNSSFNSANLAKSSFSSSSSSANALFPSRNLRSASASSSTASSASSSPINFLSPRNIFSCLAIPHRYSDNGDTPMENLRYENENNVNGNKKEKNNNKNDDNNWEVDNNSCIDTGKMSKNESKYFKENNDNKINERNDNKKNESNENKINDKNENNENKSESDKYTAATVTRTRGRGRGRGRGSSNNFSNVGRGCGSDDAYQVAADGLSGRTRSTSQLDNVDMDIQ